MIIRAAIPPFLFVLVILFVSATLMFGQITSKNLIEWLHQADSRVGVSQLSERRPSSMHITATTSSAAKALPPVHWNSSWIGNQWIPPPGYKTYSPWELREYFSRESVLVVGDSTARRTYATWYALLNATNERDASISELDAHTVIDINKKRVTEICKKKGYNLCRPMPAASSQGRMKQGDPQCNLYGLPAACLTNLQELVEPESFFRKELSQYSMVVFALGPWEYAERFECGNGMLGRRNSTEDFFRGLIDLSAQHPTVKFVWRTWSGPGATHRPPNMARTMWKSAQSHNHLVKTLIHHYQRSQYNQGKLWTQISYVDWGQVMGPRLFPESQRIAGDIDEHLGLEARTAFVQMWINHLVELERQEDLQLAPWWAMEENVDTANDCLKAGGTSTFCLSSQELASAYSSFLTLRLSPSQLTPEEVATLEDAKANFCKECIWGGNISCAYRLLFVRFRRRTPELAAMLDVMANPTCNISAASE